MHGRILVVDHKTPEPDQDSGSASIVSVLRILTAAGLGVTFAPFGLEHAGRYSRALNKLGIETLRKPNWASIQQVIEVLGPRSDILLLYRAPVASQLFDFARNRAPAARILFHPVDLHFLRMQRQAEITDDPILARKARWMRSTELTLVERADATIVVSTYEAQLLRGLIPAAPVHQIPILRATPRATGVPSGGLLRRLFGVPPKPRQDILFIAGYQHSPNVDAVNWFVEEVWPVVQARGFSERLILAGSHPPKEIRALASSRIKVRGYVRDLGPLFAGCRMSIAPLRYGGGIKGKIVTSLSYGVPVVATSCAAEGMGLVHEQDVLIADSPYAIAEEILRLYRDAELWKTLASKGYETFQSNYSIESGVNKILSVINTLLAGRPPATPR